MTVKSIIAMLTVAALSVASTCFAILFYISPTEPDPRLSSLDSEAMAASLDRQSAHNDKLAPNAMRSKLDSGQVSNFQPREIVDSAGYNWVLNTVKPWPRNSTLEEIASRFKGSIKNAVDNLTRLSNDLNLSEEERAMSRFTRASFLNYEGDPIQAYEDLCATREWLESDPERASEGLYTVIYFQGVTALRRGENENCIMCRGESSCILPISKEAQHKNPLGSRTAIKHFTEYLERFPNDGEVIWLLNVAYMTLGTHPSDVPRKYLVNLDPFTNNEFNIGKFRDIGAVVGVNRFNQAGGGMMEDFNNDRRLDLVVSTFDPTTAMALYLNNGKGTFDDVTKDAGLLGQLGGLNCNQTDYNNDGWMDVFIVRGAWLPANMAIRPTLLRNNGNNTFTDVTEEAGMEEPVNSIAATWADYDNDGWVDVFVCCERQSNRLYHNNRDGTFTERAFDAGLAGIPGYACKGANWIDIDNDGYQDIFVSHLSEQGARLYRNKRDGTFEDVSESMGIRGPYLGFSCWTWDYNNDGWQDIFATCYERSVENCVRGMIGVPTNGHKNVLYRNLKGKGFQDVTEEAGLAKVFFTMGSNFSDFDNDGFLDFYLGTGEPSLGTLVPNRMFKNVGGRRFSDITSSSGTGNLQKGHGVACGDWNADGNTDIFIEMGGAVNGDKYHNILFQNPGHSNAWVTLKLIGTKSNKAAFGARIKVVTSGRRPQTIYRHVSSGSSFGANPLEQTIGLGEAEGIESVEVYWPTSGTTQVLKDVPARSYVEITELESDFHVIERTPIQVPEE